MYMTKISISVPCLTKFIENQILFKTRLVDQELLCYPVLDISEEGKPCFVIKNRTLRFKKNIKHI